MLSWMICAGGAAFLMAGCGTPQPTNPGPASTNASSTHNDPSAASTTPLQVNDRIEVTLSGTPTEIKPVDMDIPDNGYIVLADIDHPIQAAGKSPQELEEIILTNLVPRMYTHANVTVLALARYFYVSGQINPGTGGRQLYLSRITVTGAITAAGGFNEYADKGLVQLTRQDGTIHIVDCVKALKDPKLDLEVFPGDRIEVPRRSLLRVIEGH